MKRIAGVVAEYNPFHNGHALHLQAAREKGADFVVAVMSGNYVQRGEPAFLPKDVRARAAAENGCDLVLELPAAYALSTAQIFAKGAVGLLLDFGINLLTFGCETDDLKLLTDTAQVLSQEAWVEPAKGLLKEGMSFPAARAAAVGRVAGRGCQEVLSQPNNLLAVEYLQALEKRGRKNGVGEKVEVLPVLRMGASHHSVQGELHGAVETASGSFLRELAGREGLNSLTPFVPQKATTLYSIFDQPYNPTALDKAELSRLRTLTPPDFLRYADCTEGLEHRLYRAVETAGSLEELFTLVKTKRYPLSRIRRLCRCACLGLTKDFTAENPPYLRILAMGERADALLRLVKPVLPMSHALRRLEEMGGECARFARAEAAASDFYGLGLSPVLHRGWDYRLKVK